MARLRKITHWSACLGRGCFPTGRKCVVSSCASAKYASALCAQSDDVSSVDIQKLFCVSYQKPFNVPIFVIMFFRLGNLSSKSFSSPHNPVSRISSVIMLLVIRGFYRWLNEMTNI